MKLAMKTTAAIAALTFGVLLSASAFADRGDRGEGHGHGKGKFDTNGDGVISRAEAANRPLLNKNFDAIDTNRDGALSRDEIKAYRKAHRDEFKAERKNRHERHHKGEGK